jgi:uncharacterized repeat protein (TIGR03803 family)
MRSKQFRSAAKAIFAILITVLLASVVAVQPAQARKFKVLHTFHGPNGNGPAGVLTRDSAGNLYGTTEAGGTGKCGNFGCGTAFKLNKSGKQVWLHSFDVADGEEPSAGLLRDQVGNLYGTTYLGGDTKCTPPYGCGTVFKLDPNGEEKLLYRFTGTPDGWFPESLLARDSQGNVYGTTVEGGENSSGTIFRVDKHGKESVLHSFTGGSDGCLPGPGLIADAAGNLYGVAGGGGSGLCDQGYGVVFKLDTANNLTVLHTFGFSDGAYPGSVLLFDQAGNLYGTTEGGGSSACGVEGCGAVFELSPQQDGSWKETMLYAFCSESGCADGEEPGTGPLVRDSSGNIYGTTYFGGMSRNCNGGSCGVVFKLDTTGKETVLHSFGGGGDGATPVAGLIRDAAGNLYGTAQTSGDNACNPPEGCGTVFKIIP